MAILNAKPSKTGKVGIDEVNYWINRINRNLFKKLLMLLTNGDIIEEDEDEYQRQLAIYNKQ